MKYIKNYEYVLSSNYIINNKKVSNDFDRDTTLISNILLKKYKYNIFFNWNHKPDGDEYGNNKHDFYKRIKERSNCNSISHFNEFVEEIFNHFFNNYNYIIEEIINKKINKFIGIYFEEKDFYLLFWLNYERFNGENPPIIYIRSILPGKEREINCDEIFYIKN